MFYLFHYNVMNLFSFRCIAMSESWFPSNLSIIAHSLLLFNHDYDIIAKVIRFPLQLRGEIIKYRRNASLSLSMPKKWHTTKLLIGAIWTVVGAVAQLLGRKTDGVVGGTHMVRQLAHQRVTVDLVRVVLAVAVAIAHPGLADAASWWDHNMENLQPLSTTNLCGLQATRPAFIHRIWRASLKIIWSVAEVESFLTWILATELDTRVAHVSDTLTVVLIT